jgi:hypothetical protein
MKTNKEIIEYLKPYTEMEGYTLSTLVEIDEKVRGLLYDMMVIRVDIKSSWIGIGGVDTRHQTIKQYLTKNGFRYNEYTHSYIRPYHKKYWK